MAILPEVGQQRVFAVHFETSNDKVEARIQSEFPHAYKLSSTLYLVRSTQLANDIAVRLGIKGSERFVSGVVFLMNHIYSGYYTKTLWDWLRTE